MKQLLSQIYNTLSSAASLGIKGSGCSCLYLNKASLIRMNVKTKIATAVSVAVMVAAGSAAAEVTLYDYTEATSSYEDAYIDGSFSADGGNQGQSSYDADLSVSYDRVFSSPNRNIGVTAGADGSVGRGDTKGAGSSSTFSANVSATADNYFRPGSKGAFWYGSGALGALKDADNVYSKVGVGLGYGRVVNVTPMAKSMRLIEALGEQGALKATPSKATYVAVANIIGRENEYKSKFGLASYDQHWIADIEKALMAGGQVAGGLRAGGVIKANDVLQNEFISTRRHGWLVRAGLGVVLSNYDDSDGGDPSLDLAGEYHLPLDNQTQFSNVAALSTIYGDDDTGYNVYNNMTLTKEITDKVDWENSWLLNHSKAGDDAGVDSTQNTLSSAFRYYLDNQLDLKIIAKATKTKGLDDVDTSLNMGVSYRLR